MPGLSGRAAGLKVIITVPMYSSWAGRLLGQVQSGRHFKVGCGDADMAPRFQNAEALAEHESPSLPFDVLDHVFTEDEIEAAIGEREGNCGVPDVDARTLRRREGATAAPAVKACPAGSPCTT